MVWHLSVQNLKLTDIKLTNAVVGLVICFAFIIFNILSKERLKRRQKGDSLRDFTEDVPARPQGIARFHGVRLWWCISLGLALDYYSWVYSNTLSHLVSIRSVFDTLYINRTFIPEGAVGTVIYGQNRLALDVTLVFFINIALAVFGSVLLLLFAWSVGKYLYYKKAIIA
jgi:hypothetical protein